MCPTGHDAAHLGKPSRACPDRSPTSTPRSAPPTMRGLRAFLDQFGSSTSPSSTTATNVGPFLDRALLQGAGALRRGDGDHAASLRQRRAADLFALPADLALDRRGPPGFPILEHDVRQRAPSPTRIPTSQQRVTTLVPAARQSCNGKAHWAMRGLRSASTTRWRAKELIDSVKLIGRDRAPLGGHAAGGLQIRAFSWREGAEDFQVQGQRAHHRGMATLAEPGNPLLFMYRERRRPSVSIRCHSPHRDGVSAVPRSGMSARTRGSAFPIRYGTSMASSPKLKADLVHGCCYAGRILERGDAETAVGLYCRLPSGRDRRTRHPKLRRRWSAMPFTISATSSAAQKNFASRERAERAASSICAMRSPSFPPARARSQIQEVCTKSAGASRSSTRGGRSRPRTATRRRLDWVQYALHVLLGRSKGRAFSSFVAVYGVQNVIDMIDGAASPARR